MGQVGETSPHGVGLGKHSCWGYADEEAFRRDAGRFIQQGIDAGEQVITVGDWSRPTELRSSETAPKAIAMSLKDFYGDPPCESPREWRARFSEVLGEMVQDDASGVRVISDATPVVAEVDKEAFIAWELTIGRLTTEYPLTVVCGIQPSEVDKEKVVDLGSVHTRLRGPIPVPLASVHMSIDTVFLRGEFDSSTLHLIDLALRETEGDVTLDLTEVEFMDLRSIGHLQQFVVDTQSANRSVRWRGVPEIVGRSWGLLEGRW